MDVQLAISTGLIIVASFSVLGRFLFTVAEGRVQLPLDEDASGFDSDPFQVAVAQDAFDGYPIKEEDFWIKVVRRARY